MGYHLIDWNYSLIAWWNFENVNSSGRVFDNSTYGYDGDMTGFSSNTTVAGKRGQGLEFNIIGEYIDTNTDIVDGFSEVTVCAWAKSDITDSGTELYILYEGSSLLFMRNDA